MLSHRLRNHTPALDTLILEKFVDIALISSEKIFVDIVRKFNDISRQSLSPENKMVTTAVCKNILFGFAYFDKDIFNFNKILLLT